MVYILFPCSNVLPKAHFTKEPSRQILGKQFLHRSYPSTISRLTACSLLFNCILSTNKSQRIVSKHFACQRLLWAFCFLNLKPCIEIFRKMCFEVWLKDWVTEVGGGALLAELWFPEWELPNLSTFSPSFSLSFLLPVSQESDGTQYHLAKSRTRSSKFVHLIPILLVACEFQARIRVN